MSLGEGWQRTHTCGDLRSEHAGESVTLNGWVAARRDHGGIYFVDLRDRYGLTQVVLSEEVVGELKLAPEDVLCVRGEVRLREERNINPNRETGKVEVLATSVEVLSESKLPPFEIIDDLDTGVELRLKYRFLDLRRAPLQKNLIHRSRFINAMRRAFEAQDFAEVETPILTKATPEGARDYLVPSRVRPGEFYALPQSPQIFKQLLMVSGLDRYFQVARCFRDEDLRADRQPEFTQLDMEMSFVEEDDIFQVWEKVLVETFADAMDTEVKTPITRIRYSEAMERFGLDKPDLRFGMELVALDDWARACDFGVFSGAVESGGRVMGITVDGGTSLSRKEITALEEVVKTYGAKGLAFWKPAADGGTGPLARFVGEEKAAGLMELMGAKEGDLCLFVADSRERVVHRSLGELRVHLGKALKLTDAAEFCFLWVTHFPLFDWDDEAGRWFSTHHPFTAPEDWDLGGGGFDLNDPKSPIGDQMSRSYDLVMNGWELGSGSIRIHRSDVQQRVFEVLGIGEEEQRQKFGFLIDALGYGAPPHGGFAVGLDRLVALTLGMDNIRDVIAFPKTASAADLMCDAPSTVEDYQLNDVHIALSPRAIAALDSSEGDSEAKA
jgi:aspartyl-tRNA synthetase